MLCREAETGPMLGAPLKRTGLRCPACKQPVAIIENQLPHVLVMMCPGCGHRWIAEEPGAPKQ